jgi:pyruvate kinase
MIARGDMGVEIPYEELPAIQKKLITKCRLLGKRVITATEMLESMIQNPRPTRAEISDVANAVYDGTSAIMLSGETAAGKYPVEAVKAMDRIAFNTEQNIHYSKRFLNREFKIKNTVDAISHAPCGMAIDIDAKAIAVCSLSGMTARMVSRFRPPVSIIGLTTEEKTWRELSLSWGVIPVLCENFNSTDVLFYTAAKLTKDTLGFSPVKLEVSKLISSLCCLAKVISLLKLYIISLLDAGRLVCIYGFINLNSCICILSLVPSFKFCNTNIASISSILPS